MMNNMLIELADRISFSGSVPSSKSIVNRMLIIQSFFPELNIQGNTKADDVLKMKGALLSIANKQVADCGAAGTTLRFMTLRCSRIPGQHQLSGSSQLFLRPHLELQNILLGLGVKLRFQDQKIFVSSEGWKIPESPIRIDGSISSQFTSALLLSAWGLEEDLQVVVDDNLVSQSYLQMTIQLLEDCGMNLSKKGSVISVAANSKVKVKEFIAESDLSSAFALAAVAVAKGGRIEFQKFPMRSVQPDIYFLEILKLMGVKLKQEKSDDLVLEASGFEKLSPVTVNLNDCPDLFPVLSVLCSACEGESRLFGAPQLAFKESSRIEKSAELLQLMDVRFEKFNDGMKIFGVGRRQLCDRLRIFSFDPSHDHRLAMAAGVAAALGNSICIHQPDVVDKSFPEFWQLIKNQPGMRETLS